MSEDGEMQPGAMDLIEPARRSPAVRRDALRRRRDSAQRREGTRGDGDEMGKDKDEATARDDDGFFDSVMATATWRENTVPTSSAGQPAPRDRADGSVQESAHPAPFKTLFPN